MNTPLRRNAAPALEFVLEVDTAVELAFNAKRADALITVHARSGAADPERGPSAEIIIMDRSLSMAGRGKISEAKRAACAAIDALADGTYLGIVAGHNEAEAVFTANGGLARVTADVKKAAKRRVTALRPMGGTAIGTWLRRAAQLFETVPGGTVRHAALYTDGRNEHESSDELGAALSACADRFVCDVRGLGEDWNYAELLRIAQAMHGEAKAVVDVADLTADFARLMEQARTLVVPRVYLDLHLNDRFRLGFIRQTRPTEADLTALQQREGRDIHVPLGAWAAQTRQYQLSLTVDADTLPVNEEFRAAWFTLLTEAPDGSRQQCADAHDMVVRRNSVLDTPPPMPEGLTLVELTHELGMAMRACANNALNADFDEADRELREALRLARDLGDEERLRQLESIATVDADGTAHVRRDVTRGELQRLGVESSRSGPVPKHQAAPDKPAPGPLARKCAVCGQTTRGQVVKRCENCGRAFDETGDNAL